MAKKESNLASVLSFEKKLVLSDGYMYCLLYTSDAADE